MKQVDQKAEYFNRKVNMAAINEEILETNNSASELKRQIDEINDVVRVTTKRLEIEEREIANPGLLSRRTMTIEEFRDHKKGLQEWQIGLPNLKVAIDLENQELSILKSNLAIESRALNVARSEIVAGMVDNVVDEFSTGAGELFKNLVLTIVASAGKDKGWNLDQQQQYHDATCKAIFEKILPCVFAGSNSLPDLQEANCYVTDIIEGVA